MLEKLKAKLRERKSRLDRERAERAWDRRQKEKQRAREEEPFEVIYPEDDSDDDDDYEARHPERYRRGWKIGLSDDDVRPK